MDTGENHQWYGLYIRIREAFFPSVAFGAGLGLAYMFLTRRSTR